MVRTVAERALTRHGYKVLTANNGEEALEIIDRGDEIALLISDVVMPLMDGPTMVRGGAEDAAQAADPVHVRLCRGAAQEIDRHRQCRLFAQALLGPGTGRGGAQGAGRQLMLLPR